MAKAYTPGLKVVPHTRHHVRRQLPISGDVLVKKGDRVAARDVVAETRLPGDVTPINMANQLSCAPDEVKDFVLKKVGDKVTVGEVMARTRGIFGMFKSEYKARIAGTIENISDVTGQVIIRGDSRPVQVMAYLAGEVTEVFPGEGVMIESEVTYIQGIFGIAGEAFGPIRMACATHEQELASDLIHSDMKGAVVIGGARMTAEAITRARDVGAAAIVSGGIDDQDLRNFLGYDIGVAVTGSEDVGLTLIITEGFGEIAMAERTFQLLAEREGHEASVNGSTQIRAGVMRPEIIVPLSEKEQVDIPSTSMQPGALDVGAPVRIIRDPYFGLIGKVSNLPAEPAVLPSGSKARVLEVAFDSGEHVTVPRANVELIEGLTD